MTDADLAAVRLTLAALRDAGVPFDDAWPVALPVAAEDGSTLRYALDKTRRSWERAYVGEPPSAGERAAAFLFGWRMDDAEEDRSAELVGVRCG